MESFDISVPLRSTINKFGHFLISGISGAKSLSVIGWSLNETTANLFATYILPFNRCTLSLNASVARTGPITKALMIDRPTATKIIANSSVLKRN